MALSTQSESDSHREDDDRGSKRFDFNVLWASSAFEMAHPTMTSEQFINGRAIAREMAEGKNVSADTVFQHMGLAVKRLSAAGLIEIQWSPTGEMGFRLTLDGRVVVAGR